MECNEFITQGVPKPIVNLLAYIKGRVNSESFYSSHIPDFSFSKNQICPFKGHVDTNASFRAKPDGSFKCYGCEKSGSNIAQFLAYKNQIHYNSALMLIYENVHHRFTESHIAQFQDNLKRNSGIYEYLTITRGWSPEVIKFYQIGSYTKDKTNFIVIPHIDEYGVKTQVKFHCINPKENQPKCFLDNKGRTDPLIFGSEILKNSTVVYIMEGEPDCMLALSLGLPAITFGSASTFKEEWRTLLKDYHLIIVYDNDKAGEQGRRLLTSHFAEVAKTLKTIDLPPKMDFTEYMSSVHFDIKEFLNIVTGTDYYTINTIRDDTLVSHSFEMAESTTLGKACQPENHGKLVSVHVIVAGKADSPFIIPRKIRATCKEAKRFPAKCSACPIFQSLSNVTLIEIEEYHPALPELIFIRGRPLDKVIRNAFSIPTKCSTDIRVEDTRILEKIVLNEPIIYGESNSGVQNRRIAFYLGSGLQINNTYIVNMYTISHPSDNTVVHIITAAEPQNTDISAFRITEDIMEPLKSFRGNLENKLDELHTIQSKNITRIWNRPLLHIGVDLLFFCPNSFTFNGEFVPRGGLDVLVFGDPRCGKGKVAEGLSRYYQFGEVLSGENISFMNLVGGIESFENYRGLRWGRFVANNLGVVIVDEMSSIPTETLGKCSRIRSEGIAEIDKYGIHSQANAQCSTLWISNPRDSKLADYNFGVEAIVPLVGQIEDIARFDFSICVQSGEVSRDVINKTYGNTEDLYGPDLNRSLILWCKSRKADEVIFSNDCIDEILNYSKMLGDLYSSSIPLIQGENVRIKLARISAAYAGRTFSSSRDGALMIVDIIHAKAAFKFLMDIYSTPAMGYFQFSKLREALDVSKPEEINAVFKEFVEDENLRLSLQKGLLQLRYITKDDIGNYSGLQSFQSQDLTNRLVQMRALNRQKFGYVKTQEFKIYLKQQLNGHLT